MVIIYPNEEYREIKLHDSLKLRYAVSNTGKFISFTESFHDGRILKGCMVEGYRILRYRIYVDGGTKKKHLLFYKAVAECFIPKPSDEHVHILHLNYDKTDDRVENLKWATKAEKTAHFVKNPLVIAHIKRMKEHTNKPGNRKLTAIKVRFIKRLVHSKKTRTRMIAKQFGVSDTQIKRIERGENWKEVAI